MNHKLSGLLVSALSIIAPSIASAQGGTTAGSLTPIRPPAVPLIVRQPYVSTWQPSDTLTGKQAMFWAGQDKALTGLAQIDGRTYTFMGNPQIDGRPIAPMMDQTSLRVTPTQTIYTFQAAGVTLSLDFLSPVEPNDLQSQSVPLSYIFASARSAVGAHNVRLYFDITGQWASGDTRAPITWTRSTLPDNNGPITAWSVMPSKPKILAEDGDSADWGQAIWATRALPELTTQAGSAAAVRTAFVQCGVLDNSVDADQPRAINDSAPVFAFDFNLGQVGNFTLNPSQVGAGGAPPIVLTLGDVRNPAVSYQKTTIPPLWLSYWPDWQHMTASAADDALAARARADALDQRVTTDATKAGGVKYAALCALALRQAFGTTELVGTAAKPWMFMKEISSDGNISTIDVVYPAFPVFLYASPTLLRLQLDPLLDYAESGKWTQPYAEHDIGDSYPNADGHNDGGGENMPVEESANMLIMTAAYLRYASHEDAVAYATQHYRILKQWADYLLAVPAGGTSPNALDPQFQNQTDDFTGPIAHSVNLALKGIIGVGAMGQIAGYAGETADKTHYDSASRAMIGEWSKRAQSKTGPHLTMQYIEADTPQATQWTSGIVGPHGLAMRSAGGGQTPQPVVDTAKSYTVAAWVKPTTIAGFQTYVSIDGSQVSGFFLQLRSDTRKFAISALSRDSEDPGAVAYAGANDAPVPGTWYHLAGVYDASAQTLSLYVDGVLQQTVPYTAAFQATGASAIGRGFYGGDAVDFADASIDDVRFYQAALPTADIQALAQKDDAALSPVAATTVAFWKFDEGTGDTAADASGNGHTLSLVATGIDPNDAWSLKYNAFPDRLLGLNLIPKAVLTQEAAFYKTKLNSFGVPLDPRHTYTKDDWELWTAASTDDPVLRQDIVDAIYKFADTSSARVPFGDWYDTVSGQQIGFQARPVIGGLFAVLDRTALRANK